MKKYLIVQNRETDCLEIMKCSTYHEDPNAVFSYEPISDADDMKEAEQMIQHIKNIGGIEKYFDEIEENVKNEQKDTFKENIIENVNTQKPAIPRNYLDLRFLKKFQNQLNEMEDYFTNIRLFLIEDDELNRVRLNDDSREEEYVYFKDAEDYLRGFIASLSKLYDFTFHHEEFEDSELKKKEKNLELEHLIISYPLYYIKQALYKEEAALELAAKYDEEQLKEAIKNYDKSEYQAVRKELQEQCCNPITYKVSFEMKVVGPEYNQNILKESVRRGMYYNDMNIIGDIKMEEED